jgi:mono/diheme cytochrome c family protein
MLGLLGLTLVALGATYAWSQLILSKTYEPAPRAIAWTEDPSELARGERLTQVFGCFHGCHGADMEGKVFLEDAFFGRFIAPNLTQAVRRYTPEQFEAIVRQGIRPNGHGVLGMPSAGFSIMTDRDLGAIYSFISAFPEQPAQDLGRTSVYPFARLFLALGEFKLPPEEIDDHPWDEGRLSDPLAHGAYLVSNACSECHGLDGEGSEGFAPPLVIAKAYDREAFRRLMATGVGIDENRDLGLMSLVAQNRFAYLNDDEVDALYAYLQSR